MEFGVYLTGPFGQSQELYAARNAVKRGRASPGVIEKQIRDDTKFVVDKQIEAGFSFVIDPMFRYFDLFQPITEGFPPLIERVEGIPPLRESVRGFSEGPQENWFDNNVFYMRPQVNGTVDLDATGFTEPYLHADLLPEKGRMVVLPSPFTLMMLSTFGGVNGYEMPFNSRKSAVSDLAQLIRNEAQHLASKGFSRIQYDEPAIVFKQYLGATSDATQQDMELLRLAMQYCGRIDGATTVLHTYFGSAGPILQRLLELEVDGLGIDAIETSLSDLMQHKFFDKELVVGLLDTRSTVPEIPQKIIQRLYRIVEATAPKALWLTPNTATEYRGWSNGMEKMRILKEVKEALGR